MFEKHSNEFTLVFSDTFRKRTERLKKKNKGVYDRLEEQMMKIAENPSCGKPLRNVLRNHRRIHIDSYVLLYEVFQGEIRFLDFDHHDKIYKIN